MFLLTAADAVGLITEDMFVKCVTGPGNKPPPSTIFKAFNERGEKDGGITTPVEALMAVTQMAYETSGFHFRRELACKDNPTEGNCATYDRKGCPEGQYYYGRGFIQLTHCYNYRAASQALYGDDRLVLNPDLVASDDDAAMGTALWYWKSRVHSPRVSEGYFGDSTRAINGGECGVSNGGAKKRWANFLKCLEASGNIGLNHKEEGCYNQSPSFCSKH